MPVEIFLSRSPESEISDLKSSAKKTVAKKIPDRPLPIYQDLTNMSYEATIP
jgi:hypothetical protein